MEKAYKFRLYPNRKQETLIQRTFGFCRFVYNHFLARRMELYETSKETMGYFACSAQLTQLKQESEHLWLQEVDSTALQSSLKALDTAYQNFFRRVKKGEKPGFPKFKSKKGSRKAYQSKCGKGNIVVLERQVKLPKLGLARCAVSRPVEGRILSATVSQVLSGKYYVSLLCTEVEIEQQPSTGAVLGLDLGLRDFAVDSNCKRYPNPKFSARSKKALAKAQRRLSRKTIGSSNREKARLRVTRLHEHIASQRKDMLHKLSSQLVREHDVLCVEDLSIQKILRQPYLAGQIQDAAWGEFLRLLEYKCRWQHKALVKVDKFFPSTQLCSECGFKNEKLKTAYRPEWICPHCGAVRDIDFNAAQNILAEGLRLLGAS